MADNIIGFCEGILFREEESFESFKDVTKIALSLFSEIDQIRILGSF